VYRFGVASDQSYEGRSGKDAESHGHVCDARPLLKWWRYTHIYCLLLSNQTLNMDNTQQGDSQLLEI